MDDPIAYVRQVLRTTPARWLSLTEALAPAWLTLAPAPGEWSALACLHHLIDTERHVFPARVEAFLAGRDVPAFDPATQGTPFDPAQSPTALAAEFARLREQSLALLARVTPADLERRVRHSELGVISLSEQLHEWAAHDLAHTVQAERALMQPLIRGCGPWQPDFADHLISRNP